MTTEQVETAPNVFTLETQFGTFQLTFFYKLDDRYRPSERFEVSCHSDDIKVNGLFAKGSIDLQYTLVSYERGRKLEKPYWSWRYLRTYLRRPDTFMDLTDNATNKVTDALIYGVSLLTTQHLEIFDAAKLVAKRYQIERIEQQINAHKTEIEKLREQLPTLNSEFLALNTVYLEQLKK